MSTSLPSVANLGAALASIPKPLRTRLVNFHTKLKEAYAKGDFDACGSRAGKFSETLIRTVQHVLESKHTPFGTTLNLYAEARRLENLPKTTGPEPLRVFIPRALSFLYTLRNKRGFAHVGGDLDSDPFDAVTCVRVADWCLCELIRVVHGLSLEDAQTLVNTLATRDTPDVWAVGGRKRVLRQGLSMKDQTLLLLYSEVADAVLIEDLFEWTEYARFDHYKARILAPLHQERLIEWDRGTETAVLSPTGVAHVETSTLGFVA